MTDRLNKYDRGDMGELVLRGERVLLRPVHADDLARLTSILAEPGVARWWNGFDAHVVEEELSGAPGKLAIEFGGTLIGLIQYEEETDLEFRHAGIDIFLASEWHRRGLGPEALRVVARYLFSELDHHRLVIDPALENVAAIKACERVGFRRVGVMHSYWRDGDGEWRDGLLMEMLAHELIED